MPEAEADGVGRDVPERLLKLVRATVDVAVADAEITMDMGLLGRGLGLDSIEALALVSAIEAEFAVTIDDADLRPEHFATVGALAGLVRGCLRR